MLKFKYIAHYSHPQEDIMVSQDFYLSLAVSGLEKSKRYLPDGSRLQLPTKEACLNLMMPNTRHYFKYNADRSNYVIKFDTDKIRYSNDYKSLIINHNGNDLNLPFFVPLNSVELVKYIEIFQYIIKLTSSPLPACFFEADMMLGSLLVPFINYNLKIFEHNAPVDLLKQCIEKDTLHIRNISEMCREIGYSSVYLRAAFKEKYHLSPEEYRMQLRLHKIKQMMTSTNMTFKEIAFASGMKNNTHLNNFIRKYCNMTPKELKKNLNN